MLNIRFPYTIVIILIIVITLLYLKISGRKLNKRKKNDLLNFIAALTVTIFVISLLFFPEECYQAAVEGVDTWINIVLPALLPFFIGAELLIGLGVIDFAGTMLEPVMRPVFKTPGLSALIFIMSITSGYPVGVKLTCNLREKGMCTRAEGQRMLAFCSTSGPLFMIGAVSIGMFGSRSAGTIIAISHYLAAVLIGIMAGILFKDRNERKFDNLKMPSLKNALDTMLKKRSRDGRPIGTLLGDAVRESINTLLIVGGFIIMFSVVIRLFHITGALQYIARPIEDLLRSTALPSALVQPVLSGMLEITIGSRLISQVETLPLVFIIASASLIIGWSGFSIHAQAISFISRTDLSPAVYMLTKLGHGILSCATSFLICKIVLSGASRDVFLPETPFPAALSFSQGLLASAGFFIVIVLIMLVFAFFCKLLVSVTGFWTMKK
jgi:sporulation integral membrane protein YlbJ